MSAEESFDGKPARLASLDALRGFNMFFITGGSALVAGICSALKCPDAWIATQMKHVEWVGFAHHDTIFPLFLFLAGVSWPFSLASQLGRGRSVWAIQLKALARVAVLFLFGLSFGGILKFNPNFRLMSVLGFIGLSWGVAASLSLYVRKVWKLFAIAAVLLAGYYLLLHFCPAPDAPVNASPYSPQGNYPAYLDRMTWPNHLLSRGRYDPESFFSVPGGIALAVFGILAGRLLRWQDGPSPLRKSLLLAAWAGVAGVAACTFEYALGDPPIKKLWTPSFVLYSATYALVLLALFHGVVDVLGLKRWTVVFDPVGKNSLLAYLLSMVGVAATIQRFFFSGLCKWAEAWGPALAGLTTYLVVWSTLAFFRRKGIFLKA